MKGKLEVKGLSAGYGKKRVIENVSFEAERGKLTVIVCPNGSGKSTLLKAISRIIKPDSGTVTLDGENLDSLLEVVRSAIIDNSEIDNLIESLNDAKSV